MNRFILNCRSISYLFLELSLFELNVRHRDTKIIKCLIFIRHKTFFPFLCCKYEDDRIFSTHVIDADYQMHRSFGKNILFKICIFCSKTICGRQCHITILLACCTFHTMKLNFLQVYNEFAANLTPTFTTRLLQIRLVATSNYALSCCKV